jgi:hypothetical protein
MTSDFLRATGRISLAAALLFAALATLSPWALVGAIPAAAFGVYAVVRAPSKRNEELGDEALAAAEEWDRAHGIVPDSDAPRSSDRPGEDPR